MLKRNYTTKPHPRRRRTSVDINLRFPIPLAFSRVVFRSCTHKYLLLHFFLTLQSRRGGIFARSAPELPGQGILPGDDWQMAKNGYNLALCLAM
jgi:hypothetical protein